MRCGLGQMWLGRQNQSLGVPASNHRSGLGGPASNGLRFSCQIRGQSLSMLSACMIFPAPSLKFSEAEGARVAQPNRAIARWQISELKVKVYNLYTNLRKIEPHMGSSAEVETKICQNICQAPFLEAHVVFFLFSIAWALKGLCFQWEPLRAAHLHAWKADWWPRWFSKSPLQA